MTRRRIALAVVGLAGLIAAFVFMHSGSRGVAMCMQEGFSGPGSLSLWPPGAQCTGGEPQFSVVYRDPSFLFLAAVGAMLGAGVLALRRRPLA